jgi:succinyl-diaminopimelate desuccinylase
MSALVMALEDYKRTLAKRAWRTPEGVTMRPTINVGGVFHCGEGAKINTVPAHASFTIDRRVLAVESHAAAERELRAFLRQAAAEIPQCRIEVKKISENYSCFSAPEHPFFTAMADCVTRVRRRQAVFNVSTGFNDMHFSRITCTSPRSATVRAARIITRWMSGRRCVSCWRARRFTPR